MEKQKRKNRKKWLSTSWLLATSLIMAGLLIFLVIGATRSSELSLSLPSDITTSSTIQISDTNKTIDLAQQIAQQLISQIDMTQIDPSDTNSAQLVKNVNWGKIEQSFGTINTDNIFYTPTSIDEKLITTDLSQSSITNYMSELSDIIKQTKNPILAQMQTLTLTTENKDTAIMFFGDAALKYNEAYNRAKNLIVPSLLKEQHAKELSLLLEQKNIFEAFENIDNDPYKALLAIVHAEKANQKGVQLEKEIMTIVSSILGIPTP